MKLREPLVLENEFKITTRHRRLDYWKKHGQGLENAQSHDDDSNYEDSLEGESQDERVEDIEEDTKDRRYLSRHGSVDGPSLSKNGSGNESNSPPTVIDAEKQASQNYLQWLSMLPDGLELPDSDILKALHTYASDFYGSLADAEAKGVQAGVRHGTAELDFQNMDSSALIALGVLVEELTAKELGSDGDLALLESLAEDQGHFPSLTERRWNGKEFVHRACQEYQSRPNDETWMASMRMFKREELDAEIQGRPPPSMPLSMFKMIRLGPKKYREYWKRLDDPYETDVDDNGKPIT
jgi:hypothetical protein